MAMRPSTEAPPQPAQSECRQKNEVDLHKCGAPKSAADLGKAAQMPQRRKRAPPAKRQVQSKGKQEGDRTSNERVPPPAAARTWWQGRNGSEERQQQEDDSRKQSLRRGGWGLPRRERQNRPGRPQKEVERLGREGLNEVRIALESKLCVHPERHASHDEEHYSSGYGGRPESRDRSAIESTLADRHKRRRTYKQQGEERQLLAGEGLRDQTGRSGCRISGAAILSEAHQSIERREHPAQPHDRQVALHLCKNGQRDHQHAP